MPYTVLRYDAHCVSCGGLAPAGARGWWDPESRSVTCGTCRPQTRSRSSARSFADGRAEDYRARVRRTWGPFAPLVLALRPDDADVRAAVKGADGEEQLARVLDRLAARSGGTIAVLHDRAIPGRRENLDHVVVTPGGIWAVDAKAYAGRISTGGWFAERLSMGRRDGDRLVDQSLRQQGFLTDALPRLGLPALPVHGALCFLDADMGWATDGTRVRGVVVCRPRKLRRLLRAPGDLTPEQVAWTAARLSAWFTPSR